MVNLVYVTFIDKKSEEIIFEYQVESQNKIENLETKISDMLAKTAADLIFKQGLGGLLLKNK